MGLLGETHQGRHRYVRMEDPAIAEAIESLAALSGRVRPAKPSLRAQNVDRALREARTCYRHLAGRLGVALSGGMRRLGYVDAQDRKSTRLNSSHVAISYAVFCLKKN